MTVSNQRPHALFILDEESMGLIYGPEERREIDRLAHVYAPPQTPASIAANPAVLADVEVVFSGWGTPVMDESFLSAAPGLRAVFHGAGSTGFFTTEAFWDRGIIVTSAYAANAKPVAEYVLGVILLSLKDFWRYAAETRNGQGWGTPARQVVGAFRSTVALIGCGMIARRLIELMKPLDLRCIVYDPFLSEAGAEALGVKLCTLDEAFASGDVVSLHAPDKPETNGMITGTHIRRMKPGATFINTARGRVVRETEMVQVLEGRPDLTAILDVCHPEPPVGNSPLLTLPNAMLTPHIAGSMGPECRRMGSYAVEEFRRYLKGEPLKWEITRKLASQAA